MTYRIAYGVDTETLVDPDELALLDLPDKCMDMESVELESWIHDNWGSEEVKEQPMVGLDDVLENIRMSMVRLGIATEDMDDVVGTLIDYTVNHVYG